MRHARADPRQRPFDAAPVAGDQQVGRDVAQRGAEAAQIAAHVAFDHVDLRKADVERRVEQRARLVAPVHGEDGMAKGATQAIGEGREAHLRPAGREAREDM